MRQVEGQGAAESSGMNPDGEPDMLMGGNQYKETPYNELTSRLSNWISDRLEPASLVDYGKVNLMQNRYELRMFLETNHKRYLKAMEDQKIQQAAENRKDEDTESE